MSMEDYSKEYLDGKFGAIPIIKYIIDWEKVWEQVEKKEAQKVTDSAERMFYHNVRQVLL